MLSITGVSRTRNSRCCWGFCGPFFSSPRGEGGGEKGGNRSPGSKTMCSSSCQGQRGGGEGEERLLSEAPFLDNSSEVGTSHGVRAHQLAESAGAGPVGLDSWWFEDQRRKNRTRWRKMSQPFFVPQEAGSWPPGSFRIKTGTLPPLPVDSPAAFPGKEKSLALP